MFHNINLSSFLEYDLAYWDLHYELLLTAVIGLEDERVLVVRHLQRRRLASLNLWKMEYNVLQMRE